MSESVEELNFDELMAESDLSDYAERRISQIGEIADVRDSGRTAWESEFLASLVRQLVDSGALTDKQQSKLDEIYERFLGEC